MISTTAILRFYKSNRHLHWSNPARRWVWHRIGLGVVVGALLFFPISSRISLYMYAEGNGFATTESISLLELLPLNAISRLWGYTATSELLPQRTHHSLIRWFVWALRIRDVDESVISQYNSLQEFFSRADDSFTFDRSESTCLVAPCSGVILQQGDATTNEELVQVKGCTFKINNLIRAPINTAPPGTRRVFFVLRIRLSDSHRFYSPTEMSIRETTYCPGTLFPTSPSWARYMPQLYTSNERVNLIATSKGGGAVAMSCVGGFCTGNVHLHYDERVTSNLRCPPEFTLRWRYGADAAVHAARGEELGYFCFGSAIVVVADVPKSATAVPHVGDVVRAGSPLIIQ